MHLCFCLLGVLPHPDALGRSEALGILQRFRLQRLLSLCAPKLEHRLAELF
jgi:hypothetical protein